MKKLLSLLCGSLVVLLMFAGPVNTVAAAEQNDDCECHNVTILTGAEKNKIVSDLLKTDEFKNAKKEIMNTGYKWNGVNNFEVIKFNVNGLLLVGLPLVNEAGTIDMFVFMDGVFMGLSPM